ncbi:hypothetical protein NHJ6243_002574 [Beauveria neobassiana]
MASLMTPSVMLRSTQYSSYVPVVLYRRPLRITLSVPAIASRADSPEKTFEKRKTLALEALADAARLWIINMAAAIPLLLRTAFGIEISISFLPESVAPWGWSTWSKVLYYVDFLLPVPAPTFAVGAVHGYCVQAGKKPGPEWC